MSFAVRRLSSDEVEPPFDPYLKWLDIVPGTRPPDHYELLGLDRCEDDRQTISRAADVRMAKIRKIRPGEHLPDWGRLLDQLSAAKICLLDPASKAAYDASLGPTPASSPQDTAEPPSTAGVYPADLATPPLMTTPPEQVKTDPEPSPPAAPESAAPESAADVSPNLPMAASSAPLPLITPVDAAASEDPGFVAAEAADRLVTLPSAAGRSRKSSLGSGLAVGVLAALVVGLAGTFFYVVNRGPEQVAVQGAGRPEAKVKSPSAAPRPPKKADSAKTPQQPDMPDTVPPPGDPSPGQPPGNPEAGPVPDGNSDEPSQPDPQPSDPQPSDPQPQPDAKKEAAYAGAISDARSSMSRRDLPGASRHLLTAAENAQTPTEQARLARLKTMLGYLEEFFNLARAGVDGLQGAQELVVGDTRVAVVEADRQQLIVKSAGRLRSWPIEQIPTPLLIAVARDTFSQDPTSKVCLGMFLAVDPRGDPDRARQLFHEAARRGIDVTDLLGELDGH